MKFIVIFAFLALIGGITVVMSLIVLSIEIISLNFISANTHRTIGDAKLNARFLDDITANNWQWKSKESLFLFLTCEMTGQMSYR